jgi:hypothetical protein
MTNYPDRLQIPVYGEAGREFYSRSGVHVATGYLRVCIGQRGPYVEFKRDNFREGVLIPQGRRHYYFDELRTQQDNVFVYYQLKVVDYADYRPGLFYISPFDLYSPKETAVITPLAGRRRTTLEQMPLAFMSDLDNPPRE